MITFWQAYLCYIDAMLGRWEQAIDWCEKALANNVSDPDRANALETLALANAWAGHDNEARDALDRLRKVDPSRTVKTWAAFGRSLS
jgi:tetratricopeptide (TPR) repeat protein